MSDENRLCEPQDIIKLVAEKLTAFCGTTLVREPVAMLGEDGYYRATIEHRGKDEEFADPVIVQRGRNGYYLVYLKGGIATYDKHGRTFPDMKMPEFDEAIAEIRRGTPGS